MGLVRWVRYKANYLGRYIQFLLFIHDRMDMPHPFSHAMEARSLRGEGREGPLTSFHRWTDGLAGWLAHEPCSRASLSTYLPLNLARWLYL